MVLVQDRSLWCCFGPEIDSEEKYHCTLVARTQGKESTDILNLEVSLDIVLVDASVDVGQFHSHSHWDQA